MTRYIDKPDIMAIGDSMYQGIRSLSLVPWMPEHSVPAQVARAIGMTMTVPDPRHPLLWDLEAELKHGGLGDIVSRLQKICIDNLQHWPLGQPWSGHEAFDNVAVGGADIGSLWQDTYDTEIETMSTLSERLQADPVPVTELPGIVGKLWYALNTCYTLNPQHRAQQRAASQLQQVRDRAPRILLINIGSNEGLFSACFLGHIDAATLAIAAAMPVKIRELAARLRALPARVEKIVFNGLIRPRFVPNLMPTGTEANTFPGDGYYSAYGGRLTDTQQPISADTLRNYDETIATVNAESAEILREALGNRIVFADPYTASLPFDGKHYFRRGLAIPEADKIIDNRPLTSVPGGYIGGFTSLDNMHPSVPGYAVLADVVLDALGRSDLRTDKAAALAADRFLSDFPGWRVLNIQMQTSFVISIVRQFLTRPTDALIA